MARNVLRGGGKDRKVEVLGLKELEKKLKALMPDNPQMQAYAQEAVAAAAVEMRNGMRSAASAAWGGRTVKSTFGKFKGAMTGYDVVNHIFSYGRPKVYSSGRSRVTALAGATKMGRGSDSRGTMFSWKAGPHPKSAKAKVGAGGEVAMSFATALEFGTSMYPARPAIREAVKSGQSRIIATVTEKFKAILAHFAQ